MASSMLMMALSAALDLRLWRLLIIDMFIRQWLCYCHFGIWGSGSDVFPGLTPVTKIDTKWDFIPFLTSMIGNWIS